MSSYKDWGFWKNPLEPHALSPDEDGARLLVGREHELHVLTSRLRNSRKIVTVEGPNGIGKTSLINVAAYKMMEAHLNDPTQDLFVPCRSPFQLTATTSVTEFVQKVLLEVAQTLVAKGEELRPRLAGRERGELDRWLNDPLFTSIQVGVGGLLSAGTGSAPNSGAGFQLSGLRTMVKGLLSSAFPEGNNGGVVCIIDNLELVRTSTVAKQMLEALRDELLRLDGLRWVVSGSHGIVHGAFSSTRMEGFFTEPLEVGGIEDRHVEQILSSRLELFALGEREPYLPFTMKDFTFLHRMFNQNLRATLGRCDNFCQIVHEAEEPPANEDEKRRMFLAWIQDAAGKLRRDVKPQATPRALEVFQQIAEDFPDGFSPSSFAAFGYKNQQALRPQVKTLEDLGLLVTEKDDVDKRRRTIQVTSKGWLFNYAHKYSF